ncbi:MAG: CpaD family pilus assembly lipoprotein [Hyphomicrobiales bacterium]|nr:CpaD family pilus assembly lipoprotein [Hyphomicrobiales bacterium]
MSYASFKTGRAPATGARIVLAAAAVSLLAGCAAFQKRDSITVGAVPDDYRTNHPIVIAEKEETLDLPVGSGERGATASQRASLEGFLANYDKTAAPALNIVAPSGSANSAAAADAAHDFATIAKQNGVPASRIMIASYQASAQEIAAPVRVSFVAMRAQTDKCGRWPADILESSENKHYADYGCSYQNNIAAQIANPSDLLGPRKPSPIDAANREKVITDYQTGATDIEQSIDY